MRTRTVLLAGLLVFVGLGIGATPSHATVVLGSVGGVVTDAETGDPIAGASIGVLVGATPGNPSGGFLALADSGADGSWLIEDLEAGPALVDIQATGYQPFESFITIPAGSTIAVDAALAPAAVGSVGGVVTDAETGDPIAGASISVLVGATPGNPSGGFLALADSGPDGSWVIEDLAAGPALVGIQATAYQPFESFITIPDGSMVTVDAALAPAAVGSIAGVVTDAATGDPIAGAFINVLVGATPEDPSGGFIAIAEGGSDGAYLVENLAAGPALVTIDVDGYQRFEAFVTVVAATTLTLDAPMQVLGPGTTTTIPEGAQSTLPFTGIGSMGVVVGTTVLIVGLAVLVVGGVVARTDSRADS